MYMLYAKSAPLQSTQKIENKLQFPNILSLLQWPRATLGKLKMQYNSLKKLCYRAAAKQLTFGEKQNLETIGFFFPAEKFKLCSQPHSFFLFKTIIEYRNF